MFCPVEASHQIQPTVKGSVFIQRHELKEEGMGGVVWEAASHILTQRRVSTWPLGQCLPAFYHKLFFTAPITMSQVGKMALPGRIYLCHVSMHIRNKGLKIKHGNLLGGKSLCFHYFSLQSVRVGKLTAKDQTVSIFWLRRPHDLCHNYSTLSL